MIYPGETYLSSGIITPTVIVLKISIATLFPTLALNHAFHINTCIVFYKKNDYPLSNMQHYLTINCY